MQAPARHGRSLPGGVGCGSGTGRMADMLFVVTTEYVPAQNERRLAARPAHRDWLAGLKEQGLLVNGGPFEDGLGAQLVLDVADQQQLEQVLAGDPYPADSMRIVSARAWNALFAF